MNLPCSPVCMLSLAWTMRIRTLRVGCCMHWTTLADPKGRPERQTNARRSHDCYDYSIAGLTGSTWTMGCQSNYPYSNDFVIALTNNVSSTTFQTYVTQQF